MNNKPTLVMGASTNPARYSNMAIDRLKKHGHPVVALSNRANVLPDGSKIVTEFPASGSIDTVTLYLNPERQKPYYQDILALKPKRILFNPGTENPELKQLATNAGIECEEACTLVLLGQQSY